MRKLILAAAFLALAAPAWAEGPILLPDRTARETPRPLPDPSARRLFISPSGEPFRVADGFHAWFAQADADHDGAVTEAEFAADAMRVFKLYDANGDGVVDGFEIQGYERDRVPELRDIMLGGFGGGEGRRRKRREPKDAPQRPFVPAGEVGAARYSLVNEPQPLLAADADVDGKVTLEEWTRATTRRFAAIDKAKTGRITLESLKPPAKK